MREPPLQEHPFAARDLCGATTRQCLVAWAFAAPAAVWMTVYGSTRRGARIHVALLALLAAAVAGPLPAQVVGDRVRVFTTDTTVIGEITHLSEEGFELANDRLRQSFAYRDLDRLQVSDGLESRWKWGAAIGALTGAVVGHLLAGKVEYTEERSGGIRWKVSSIEAKLACVFIVIPSLIFIPACLEQGEPETATRTRTETAPTLIGAVIGGVAGGGIGTRFEHEAWESVPLEELVVPAPTVSLPGHPADVLSSGGNRVRVTVDGRTLIGRVTAVSEQEFEFVQGAMRRSFAYRDIDGLEQSSGIQSRWAEGLGIGFLGGAVTRTAIDGSWSCWTDDNTDSACTTNELLMVAWGGMGGLVGLGVGSLVRYEGWESIPLGSEMVGISPFLSPRPAPDGRHHLLLGVRVAF